MANMRFAHLKRILNLTCLRLRGGSCGLVAALTEHWVAARNNAS
jgi:hypothetical protein